MAKVKELNESAIKVVQWLNEAHAKEAELEADLTAHISLTQKASYKKRLQDHLKETKEHKRAVARRIKQIGGGTSNGSLPGVPGIVGEAAGKTVAAVKGQLGAARALVTEQAETHVRNAQEELREEHVEIALYTRIETLAEQVGDADTAQLAKRIRREEERMAKFLTAELPRLVKDVVRAEIPREQRVTTTSRRRASSTRSSGASSRSTGSRSRSTGSSPTGSGSGSGSGSRSRSATSRSSTARSSSNSRSRSAAGSTSS